MNDTFIWKTDRPWPNKRMKQGAIIGHTTPRSARLWIRTAKPGDYTLILFELNEETQPLFSQFKQVPFNLTELPSSVRRYIFTIDGYDNDTIHVQDIDKLKPLTEYGYALHGLDGDIDRIMLGQDRPYTFRTVHQRKADPFSFAFYSCHMPYKDTLFGNTDIVNIEMWDYFNAVLDRTAQEDLRFVIGGGDQVYVDGVESLNIWKFLKKVARKENGVLLPTVDSMKTWYRDIYRGYWGFESLQKVFSSYPTYMILDDHEMADGWGSHKIVDNAEDDELNELLDLADKGLSREETLTLVERMRQAGETVYKEYQHSHNPDATEDDCSYHFDCGSGVFYCLDGRTHRDVNKRSRRVLGQRQYTRFIEWLEQVDIKKTPFVFIVSAVPVMHMWSVMANADDNILADMADLQDDLRDSWEHDLHDSERQGILKAMFAASQRGARICILSGDVHTSAAFRMTDDKTGAVIYQLTSSAITYSQPRLLRWILGKTVADTGHSKDGYSFQRLALYTDSNFSLVKVHPKEKTVWFQLYGKQTVDDPLDAAAENPMTHAMVNLELIF